MWKKKTELHNPLITWKIDSGIQDQKIPWLKVGDSAGIGVSLVGTWRRNKKPICPTQEVAEAMEAQEENLEANSPFPWAHGAIQS